MTESVHPVAPSERIELLDILRGLAIFGVVLMIVLGTAQYEPKLLGEATDFLVANKALSLLSMLFGIGFGVQLVRAEQESRGVPWAYLWRMAILFALGTIHWLLVWDTILLSYAVIGCTLLPLRRLPVAALIATACLLVAALQFQRAILTPIPLLLGVDGSQLAEVRKAGEELAKRSEAVKRQGTYAQFVAVQAETFAHRHGGIPQWIRIVFPAYYLPMAVLGFAIVKSGLLARLRERRAFLKKAMVWSLAIGLLSNPLPYLSLGSLPVPSWGYRLSFLLSGPSLALFYASAVALAIQTEGGRKRLSWLRWPGRMALTNYVLATVAGVTIAYGFGFGLMKKIAVLPAWGLAVALFALLTLVSFVWLRRHEFGPLEWVWRTLAHGGLSGARAGARG